ncbi:MAG: PorV/PorQ family protein [Elusimicrobia bacterium]|nr:PorV/PorQ family protein [Elusimicrobiota bacterium]
MKKLLILAGLVFLSGESFAWMSKSDAGTCGAQFLKIGIGAKPMGMGGAAAAVTDVSSLYWNPAGLASLEKREVIAMHTDWFEDTSIEFLGAAVPVGGEVFGLSMTYLAIDGFEERTGDTAAYLSTFDANDTAVGISYAKKLGGLDAGFTIKALKSKIENYSSNVAIAADAGIIKKGLSLSGKPMSMALVLKDFGTKIKLDTKQDNLPSVIKLGMGVEVSPQLSLAADLNLPRDNEVNLNIGLEYMLPVEAVKFPIRMGYKTLNDFDTIDGFSAGFGLGLGVYNLDFAWVPYGDFDDTYRMSLSGKF